MANRNISATVSIGGTVDSSLGSAFGSVKSKLMGINVELREIAKQTKELEKQAAAMRKLGKSTAEYDKKLKELSKRQADLRGKSERLGKVGGMFTAGSGPKFGASTSALLSKLVTSERFGPAVTKALSSLESAWPLITGLGGATLAVAAAGAAAAAGIFMLGKAAANAIDSTADMADGLGVATNNLKGLRFAAAQSGIEAEILDQKLGKMQVSIESAKDGTGPAADAIRELGLSYQELASMNPEEQMLALATAMKGYNGQMPKMQLGNAIFGKNSAKFVNMMNQGGDALRSQMDANRKSGGTFSDKQIEDADKFDKAWMRAKTSFESAWINVGSKLMPIITEVLDKITGWFNNPENQKMISEWGDNLVKFAKRFSDLITPILWLFEKSMKISSWVMDKFDKVAQFSGNVGEAIGSALYADGATASGEKTYNGRTAMGQPGVPSKVKASMTGSSSTTKSTTNNTHAPVINVNLHGVTSENAPHLTEQMTRALRDHSAQYAGNYAGI